MSCCDPWLLSRLICPWDGMPVEDRGDELRCGCGRAFRVIDGIPIMLRDDVEQTHGIAAETLRIARGEKPDPPTEAALAGAADAPDPFVQREIGATGGYLYQPLVGRLTSYPIPRLRLPPGEGKTLLDIGSNWGRWSIAAARLGYRPIGIDPSIQALRAAARVARTLGVVAHYVVADARFIPLKQRTVDAVFSYSVLQHLSKEHVRRVLGEVRRVIRGPGTVLIQMPNQFGVRCLYHQARRSFRAARDFEVRYWTPRELVSVFTRLLGPTMVSVDGFFSLNPQVSDLELLPRRYRAIVRSSEALRRASEQLPFLRYAADSLYVSSQAAAP